MAARSCAGGPGALSTTLFETVLALLTNAAVAVRV
jgi:hypothetical protein